MPDFVCVDIVVDTQDLLTVYPEPSQDADAPTVVETDSCYLIAPPAYIERGQATAHLHVAVPAAAVTTADKVEDAGEDEAEPAEPGMIQWRTFSLSGNAGQSAVLYDLEPLGDAPVPARAVAAEVAMPYPTLANAFNTDPPTFEVVQSPDYYVETPILGEGRERFRMSFYVTEADREEGRPRLVGYFVWTSTLSVRFD